MCALGRWALFRVTVRPTVEYTRIALAPRTPPSLTRTAGRRQPFRSQATRKSQMRLRSTGTDQAAQTATERRADDGRRHRNWLTEKLLAGRERSPGVRRTRVSTVSKSPLLTKSARSLPQSEDRGLSQRSAIQSVQRTTGAAIGSSRAKNRITWLGEFTSRQ